MTTPNFILSLREKIGHDPLWLTGITAYVEDADGRILSGDAATQANGHLSTALWSLGRSLAAHACARYSRRRACTLHRRQSRA